MKQIHFDNYVEDEEILWLNSDGEKYWMIKNWFWIGEFELIKIKTDNQKQKEKAEELTAALSPL